MRKLPFIVITILFAVWDITVLADSPEDPAGSFQKVKGQTLTYLLGLQSEGPYRQSAVAENDKWVESILSVKEEPLIWKESEALTMNVKISSFTSRLRRMAVVFRTKGSRYEQNSELGKRIVSGIENVLKYFNPSTPRPGNWHPWLIVIPNNLGSTALLMEPYLPKELLDSIRTTLRHELTDRLVLTGTNAAWESRNHIYLALLDNDTERLKRAADYVFRTVRYGIEQGVREDYSYMFHGRIPYAGGYGTGFAQTIAEFIYVFDGTPFAIKPEHREIIVNLLLEHTRWFLADKQIDLHVRGRSLKKKGGWNSVLEAVLVLGQTNDPRKSELDETAIAMLKANPDEELNLTCAGFADKLKELTGALPKGFRFWPSGEMGVYKQADFHVGFRQFSNRVQDYEYLNREDGGEGEEGWNLAYGFTNILREDGKGSWYTSDKQEMYSEIDMEHLPGTTSRIGANPKNPKFQPDASRRTMSTTGFSLNFGKSPLSGGAGWNDGGVAGFILEPVYGDFTAKKSLYFFPGGFWALGSDIKPTGESTDRSGKPIHTTLLQWVCSESNPGLELPEGSLTLKGNMDKILDNIQWLWIKDENVAVVFNEPSKVNVRLRGKVITVWLDHSTPSKTRYAYAVLPNSSLEQTREFARKLPVRPVRYDSDVHAVKEMNAQREGIVFFAPDSCLGITAKSPAVIFHKSTGNGGIYAIQDPLHQNGKIKLDIKKSPEEINVLDSPLNVKQSGNGQTEIEVVAEYGRIHRFGYGEQGKTAVNDLRKNLDYASYKKYKVEAESDKDKTILTVHLPDEAVQNGYHLSVHYSKSQRLHDFTEADIIDRPGPGVVRYRWDRSDVSGPSVFSDYWKLKHGQFNLYLVTGLTESVISFKVPQFD